MDNKSLVVSEDKEGRVSSIICRLIKHDGFLKIDEIADKMYISRSTAERLLSDVKNELQKYDLQLLSRPKYGMKIVGSEKDKRICYSHHVDVRSAILDQKQFEIITRILTDITADYGISMNEINYYNLVLHCSIAVERIRKGNFVSIENDEISCDDDNLKACADSICAAFENSFDIVIPKNESQYILMHLLGKRDIMDSNVITEEVWRLVEKIMTAIEKSTGVSLSNDTELVTALAMHLQPLIYRSKYMITQQNPILDSIKRGMPDGYDAALLARNIIQDELGISISEEETGYIALHLSLALKRAREKKKSKKIIVVCTTGQGTARLLQYKLMSQFSFSEEDIVLTPLYRLDHLNVSDYSCIVSTISIPDKYGIPVFQVRFENNLNFSDSFSQFINTGEAPQMLERRLVFTHQKQQTREEVLQYLCGEIEQYYGMSHEFTDAVLKREQMASTEVGNLIAIPHAAYYNENHNILAVLVLDKKIKWKNQYVQIVVLSVCPLNKDNSFVNNCIASLAIDDKKVERICNNQDYDTVRKCLFGE